MKNFDVIEDQNNFSDEDPDIGDSSMHLFLESSQTSEVPEQGRSPSPAQIWRPHFESPVIANKYMATRYSSVTLEKLFDNQRTFLQEQFVKQNALVGECLSMLKTLEKRPENGKQLNKKGKQLETVESFNYLGSCITTEGGAERDIKIRIGKASAFKIRQQGKQQPFQRRPSSDSITAVYVLLYGLSAEN
ncbi:unnamed protein product [Mytilus edulis]|uniref:Uncharacterized protein n=1 Tax=Mytilus edulis TaxID=6550 RepID=A0A8S3QHC3_MYTED|nr:unnamed protein product [Mytilus edulis]